MKKKRRILLAALAVILLTGSCLPVFADTNVKLEKVKVGFFQLDGYHMEDEDGNRSGYGYEFLQKMNVYADWEYEYVGYDKTWSDMQKMLENGEIDLLTSAQKTPDRLEKYDFSSSSIGSSSTILTTKAGNDKIIAEDYGTYNHIRVGMVEGNSRNKSFEKFASEKGFSYTSVYFDDFEAMQKALQEGTTIDGAISSNLRRLDNEWVLDTFDTSPFYVIVKKGNEALLNQVNYVIKQMDTNDTEWRTNLWNKYYNEQQDVSIQFSQAEKEFIAQIKADKKSFTVVASPDRAPYSYYEEGKLKGIEPELFANIAKTCGISYTVLCPKDRKEYQKMVEEGKADIVLDAPSDYTWAEENNLVLTEPYMTTGITEITKADFRDEVKTVAIRPQLNKESAYAIDLIYSKDCTEYAALQDCIDAVVSGEADATYVHTYCAQSIMNEDYRNRLKETQVPEYPVDIVLAVGNQIDHRLIAVLNKGVNSLAEGEVQGIVLKNTVSGSQDYSVLAYMYDHPMLVLGIAVVLVVLMFAVVLLYIRTRNEKKTRAQAKELQRLMGYVCRYNESVIEVNLQAMTCRIFTQVDGQIQVVEEPYKQHHHENYNEDIYPEDYENLTDTLTEQKFGEMLQGNEEISFTVRAKSKNGSYEWYSYNLQALPQDNEHPFNFILFKRNVNEEWEKEEKQKAVLKDALENARQASMAKGTFLSRMSHEIRTPLNAVIGYMAMAKSAEGKMDKIMHCIDNSEIAARHLLSIINDVLDISSIESGKMKIAMEDFDLKQQITSITTIFFNQTKEKGINFDVKIDSLTEEWVIGDKLRLNQVLMNLMSNAVKFTPRDGHILLNITQASIQEDKVYMKFLVSDTGIGMSKEYMARLFTAFEQESATTAQKYGGSGLGLAITKNLVSMMGGKIEVASEQGVGTTFTVTMQFERSKENLKIHEESTPVDYRHLRALIVDDEENDGAYVKSLLKRCGMKSDVVLRGEDAVKQIKRRQGTDYEYNLCIMDWNMPEMDGIETAKKIREECTQEMPIIIATAYDTSEFEEAARTIGIQKVISKPLFQSTVFDLLVSSFGKYHMTNAKETEKIDVKGLRLILAEDNEMNMEIAVDVLEREGVIVDQALNGREALNLFLQSVPGTYAMILMDVQMPEMNGYEATNAIRTSSHPEAKTVPIIAMTANAFAEDVAEAITNGMNDHISKPIDQGKLFRILERYDRRGGE